MTDNRKRLAIFDYFRGISILMIVASHSYDSWEIDTFGERTIVNLISGGTSLFVFISGFFFHHIFYPNFNYYNFCKKKWIQVFIPYFILSTIGIIYFIIISKKLPFEKELDLNNTGLIIDYLNIYLTYLYTGRILTAYWYIPFITIIFALSPIFIRYINTTIKLQFFIFLLFLIISITVQRPLGNISPIHSLFYFTSVYLLGINASIHIDRIKLFLEGKLILFFILTIMLAILQAYLFDGYGSVHKELIFSFEGFDTTIIQKIAMIGFFLGLLIKFEYYNISWLKSLATMSFGIFFIHPWIGLIYGKFIPISITGNNQAFSEFVFRFLFVLVLSILIVNIFKWLLGKRSGYITGW